MFVKWHTSHSKLPGSPLHCGPLALQHGLQVQAFGAEETSLETRFTCIYSNLHQVHKMLFIHMHKLRFGEVNGMLAVQYISGRRKQLRTWGVRRATGTCQCERS
jgi:hypothetical protein